MTALTLLLLVAALGFGIALRFRLPVIPMLMAAGLIMGALSRDLLPAAMLRDTLEIGLAFLVFASGVELNPSRFRSQRHAIPWVSAFQFTAVACASLLVCAPLGFRGTEALHLAFALAASSTLVVVRHLKQNQQIFEPFGRLVLGVLLIQDVAMIAVITVLAGIGSGPQRLLADLAATILLGAIALWLQRGAMSRVFRSLKLPEETLLLGFLAVLCVFGAAAHASGAPLIAGAFFAGLSLSSTPVNGVVRGQLGSLNDFFTALFFTALGAIVIIPDPLLIAKGFALAALVIVVTVPVVTIVAEWTGLSSRASIESGLLLAQTSEFSVVLALSGLLAGQLSQEVFSLIALITVATMTVTPFVATDAFTWRLLGFHPARGRFDAVIELKDHIVIVGFGTSGMWTLKPLQSAGHQVVVIDDDPAVVEQLARSGVRVIRGDGSDARVLRRAAAHRARLVIAGTRRPSDSLAIVRQLAGQTPVLVRVFEQADANAIEQAGGIPILNSHAAAETFLEWFEKSSLMQARHHNSKS